MGKIGFFLVVVVWVVSAFFAASYNRVPTILLAKKPVPKPPINLIFVGDVLLAGGAGQMMKKTGTEYPFGKVKEILKDADLTFANLECALTGKVITRNVRVGKNNHFIFKTPPKYGKALTNAGIDIVTLANNHSFNGGESGLIETMQTLKDLQIHYIGVVSKPQKINYPLILEIKERKIAFLAYTEIGGGDGKNFAIAKLEKNPSQMLQDVFLAKKKAEIVVVSFHWGKEGSVNPTSRQQSIARGAIDAGADVIIGHHPHVLQPIETYRGKTIAYSLGNFVFDNPRPLCSKTMILKVGIDFCGLQKTEVVPCQIKNSQPYPT